MFLKLSYLNLNLALTLGYLNPALNNSALRYIDYIRHLKCNWKTKGGGVNLSLGNIFWLAPTLCQFQR